MTIHLTDTTTSKIAVLAPGDDPLSTPARGRPAATAAGEGAAQ